MRHAERRNTCESVLRDGLLPPVVDLISKDERPEHESDRYADECYQWVELGASLHGREPLFVDAYRDSLPRPLLFGHRA